MQGYYLYLMIGQKQEPLYIGISKNLTTRILNNHFGAEKGNLDEKCLYEVNKIMYHKADCFDDMKIKERYLINTLKPKYNKQHNNGSLFSYKIDFSWNDLNIDLNELLIKRERKITERSIEHICDIEEVKGGFLPYGVVINSKKRNYITIKPDFEVMDIVYQPNYHIYKQFNTYFIKINGEPYIHNFHFLSYYTANYERLCWEFDLDEKKDFLDVLCPLDNKLYTRVPNCELGLWRNDTKSVPFIKFQVVKELNLINQKIFSYLKENLSLQTFIE